MKPKYHAVKVKNPLPMETGWEVRTKIGRVWITVCDAWCVEGENAEEVAKRIAATLNAADTFSVSELVLIRIAVDTILEDGDLLRGFASVLGTNRREMTEIQMKLVEMIQDKVKA